MCVYICVTIWQPQRKEEKISPEISQIIWAKSLIVLIEKSRRSREKWLVHTANWWKRQNSNFRWLTQVIHLPLISVLDKHLVIRASKHSILTLRRCSFHGENKIRSTVQCAKLHRWGGRGMGGAGPEAQLDLEDSHWRQGTTENHKGKPNKQGTADS